MKELGRYKNGNCITTIYDDGTRVRETDEDKFIFEFAENIDLKVSNVCDMNCPMCFASGTKILMSNYTYKNIEDVEVGDKIIAFEESAKKQGYKRKLVITTVTKTFIHIEEELIKVVTDSGNSILTTPNHPFLSEGSGKNHSRIYNKIENIKIGAFLFEYGFPLDEIDWDSENYKLGYMVGSWLGDGTIKHYIDKNGYDAYNSRFVTLDEEINNRVYSFTKYFIPDIYQAPFIVTNHKNPRTSIRSNKQSVYEYFVNTCNENILKNTNKEYACGFLGGFYDSEGTLELERSLIRIANTNYDYINETERCLDILGIEYVEELTEHKKDNIQDCYHVRIKGHYSTTRFLWYTNPICQRKSLKTFLSYSEQYYKHSIVSKETIIDKQYVYNLATESHTYIANNFLVHNCHEQSTLDGKQANILNEKFINTLHPYTELAIGGGNPLSHPDLIPFLKKLKNINIIANITVNQVHFEKYQGFIKCLVDNKLIHGLGISLVSPTKEFVNLVLQYSNAVIHIINGVTHFNDLIKLSEYAKEQDKELKLLILGYKDFGRGKDYTIQHKQDIETNQNLLSRYIGELSSRYKIISFDNLAIKQLNMKQYFTDEEWSELYQGDDGTSTFFIDAVERKFAMNSTTPKSERYDLLDNVDDMFHIVQK